MKTYIYHFYFGVLVGVLTFSSCQTSQAEHPEKEEINTQEDKVELSAKKFKQLNITLDSLQQYTFEGKVYTNGVLEVPPQFEATITATLGGNIENITVMEGEDVKKGQVVAYLQHPNFIELQTSYMIRFHQQKFLTQEHERQTKLEEATIGSQREMQKITTELAVNKAELKGYEAQLKLLNLNLQKIQNGEIYHKIPVVSPIEGSIEGVFVQMGQFVDAQTKMFSVVNTQHVHADFMVFENDVMAIEKGQKVKFTIGNSPKEYQATIISVGKEFEENPKALHIHADIDEDSQSQTEGETMRFISGMYIKGEITTQVLPMNAVPESAVVHEEGKDYIFYLTQSPQHEDEKYTFKLHEITEIKRENNWIAIATKTPLPENAIIVQDGAYYLISEMKKGEYEDD